jgi:hypothetical protein
LSGFLVFGFFLSTHCISLITYLYCSYPQYSKTNRRIECFLNILSYPFCDYAFSIRVFNAYICRNMIYIPSSCEYI